MIYLSFPAFFAEFWGLYALLLAAGAGYNWLVSWLEEKRYATGYVSLLVALGVGGTIVPLAIAGAAYTMTGLDWGLATLAAFACTGAPMIVGSAQRYSAKRERERRELAKLQAQGVDVP